MGNISFIDDKGSFAVTDVDSNNNLYFPIANELGIKSDITPKLGGDSKLDQNTFILEPVSIENLHNNKSSRNFWCLTEDGYWSATGCSDQAESQKFSKEREEANALAGFMWYSTSRTSRKYGLRSKITSFVPYDSNVEIMMVEIENISDQDKEVTGVCAIPIYGRSADNIRDHRHVTSLLHRIRTTETGILVKPTLSFDERGHQKNDYTYFVCGTDDKGAGPKEFYPMVEDFIGPNGSFTNPKAIALREAGQKSGMDFSGGEAMGGLKFETQTIKPGKSACFVILLGATKQQEDIEELVQKFKTRQAVLDQLSATEKYWNKKVNIKFKSGSKDFDNYLKWVCFQPFLRRIYGCSFLPHHDYGKGGRGWRDLWQDCLALLIMEPTDVGQMIFDNYGGVRIDGTNATIIGSKQGQFIADRNGISRVWMDHGMWPYLTTKLYIDQTGDMDILLKKTTYFKDGLVLRGRDIDLEYSLDQGNLLKDAAGNVYKGTILEHMILEHFCAACETGENGSILLRGADWNDAIDMAGNKGESVAFTCAYAGNLLEMSDLIRRLWSKGLKTLPILMEIKELLEDDTKEGFEAFKEKVRHTVSGQICQVDADWLALVLEEKGKKLINHIRANEWVTDKNGNSWYNSYYDDHGRKVEGQFGQEIRMMLTGQVFAIMSQVATDKQVEEIVNSADAYLYQKEIGGYRLNTDFHEEKYDMGRMFGFAYGEKENGAVFSHMTVMYANALYQRGFVKEGYKALKTLAEAAMNYETSMIFPGIPEYFNNSGKGLYHYLTGAASWYALTMVTQAFGVKGKEGSLCFTPKLLKEQFDKNGTCSINLTFAGKSFEITYINQEDKEYGQYKIGRLSLNGRELFEGVGDFATIAKEDIDKMDDSIQKIQVILI